MILNSHDDDVPFKLPEAAGGNRSVRLIETDKGESDDLKEFDF